MAARLVVGSGRGPGHHGDGGTVATQAASHRAVMPVSKIDTSTLVPLLVASACGAPPPAVEYTRPAPPGYTIPVVDLAAESGRRVVVDREPGQYLGHVSTILLEDGRTILAVYPRRARSGCHRHEAQPRRRAHLE